MPDSTSFGAVAVDGTTIIKNSQDQLSIGHVQKAIDGNQNLKILNLQAQHSLQSQDYEGSFVDIMEDSNGLLNTVNTTNTTATYDSTKKAYANSFIEPVEGGNASGSAYYSVVAWDYTVLKDGSICSLVKPRFDRTDDTATIIIKLNGVEQTRKTGATHLSTNYFSLSDYITTPQAGDTIQIRIEAEGVANIARDNTTYSGNNSLVSWTNANGIGNTASHQFTQTVPDTNKFLEINLDLPITPTQAVLFNEGVLDNYEKIELTDGTNTVEISDSIPVEMSFKPDTMKVYYSNTSVNYTEGFVLFVW